MDKREIVNQYVVYAKGYLAFLDEKEREVRSSMAQLRRRPPEPAEEHVPQSVPYHSPPEPPPTVRVEQFAPPASLPEQMEEDSYQGKDISLKEGD